MSSSVRWFKVQLPWFPVKVEVEPDTTDEDEQVMDAMRQEIQHYFLDDSWELTEHLEFEEVPECWVKMRYSGRLPDFVTARVGLPEDEMNLDPKPVGSVLDLLTTEGEAASP